MKKLLPSLLKLPRFLFFIFAAALIIRFLYFPQNVYFGIDQARDAFESQKIYQEQDLKIIGPSTASPNLFHGPLYWYLIGPFYLLGGGNPAFPAALLLLLNAAGVFLVFWIGKTLFSRQVGIFAALLYAFSFEQTQYAMYFGNPGPAVLTTLLFWAGLALFIFRRDWRGLPVSFFGLGLSVQFEFFLFYLAAVLAFLLFVFRQRVLTLLSTKRILLSLAAFVIPTSTFILADLKFGARTAKTLFGIVGGLGSKGGADFAFSVNLYLKRLILLAHDNLAGAANIDGVVLTIVLATAVFWIARKKPNFERVFFLLIWILSTSVLLVFGAPTLYYTNIGVSAGFLLLASFLIYRISQRSGARASLLLLFIMAGNLNLISRQNPKGIINDIYVQEGMLLARQIEAIDYIYKAASGKPIVASAMTMPAKVNTTWAYLFEWRGKGKYGRLPYWAGEVAPGFPGNLPAWQSQEKDDAFFSIIEPERGVGMYFIDKFLAEQKQYGRVLEEKIWGDPWYARIVIQRRR